MPSSIAHKASKNQVETFNNKNKYHKTEVISVVISLCKHNFNPPNGNNRDTSF